MTTPFKPRSSATLTSILMLAGAMTTAAHAQTTAVDALIDTLRTNAGQALSFNTRAADAYHLLRATGDAPLLADDPTLPPASRALNFLNQFGAAIGITAAGSELELQRISTDRAGGQHVHLNQVHARLPVFGARLVVHMSENGITGVSGVFVPELVGLATQASIAESAAEATALRAVAKIRPTSSLAVKSTQLMVYRAGLLDLHEGRNYLAYEVMVVSAAGDVRERVIVDAAAGGIINQINEIHTIKNREIYSPNQDIPPVITEGAINAPADVALTGDQNSDPASRIPRNPADNLYIFAGGTYDLYANLFGAEGYDFTEVAPEDQVQKSVYLINDACPNAYWNGDSTNYCPGFDADDVVSHEWSHAYTEYTHGLIYQYQSGALNESYSDIFGETYDLVNGLEGPLGVSLIEGEYFENGGSRWVLGEDLSETAAGLLLRDMWDPDNFTTNVPVLGFPVFNTGSPGSVISSPNYYCGSGDGGGVHTNSAVPNHAYAMLVDGKSFNGVDIPAIGMTRAAHIYFHAQTHYQTPTTNFAQHADALEQSCADLQGVPLTDVLGNPSPDVISEATCAAVAAAMLAVEMRQNPREKCGYEPLLQAEASTPALCSEDLVPIPDFSETWEAGAIPAGWTVTQNITGDTDLGITWEVVADLPGSHEGKAMFLENSAGGSCAPGGDISASFQLDSPVIEVSKDASHFAFSHLMQSEFAYDGGNLKFSLNGGDFEIVPAEAFRYNGYNTTMETGSGPIPDPAGLYSGGNTSPMAGEIAWSGSDEGESFSDWGISIVELDALGAGAGDTVAFRFEFGQDGCNGNLGWYVDQLSVGHCGIASNDEGRSDDLLPPASTRRAGGGLGGLMLLALLGLALLRRRKI